jgi:hypothetical protein
MSNFIEKESKKSNIRFSRTTYPKKGLRKYYLNIFNGVRDSVKAWTNYVCHKKFNFAPKNALINRFLGSITNLIFGEYHKRKEVCKTNNKI